MKRRTYKTLMVAGVLLSVGVFIAMHRYFGWPINSAEYIFFKIVVALIFGGLFVFLLRGVKVED